MPNIYYCQSRHRGWGMLRAVVSLEEGKCGSVDILGTVLDLSSRRQVEESVF